MACSQTTEQKDLRFNGDDMHDLVSKRQIHALDPAVWHVKPKSLLAYYARPTCWAENNLEDHVQYACNLNDAQDPVKTDNCLDEKSVAIDYEEENTGGVQDEDDIILVNYHLDEIDTPDERQLPNDDTLGCLFVSTDNMDTPVTDNTDWPIYLFQILLPYVVAIGTLGSLAPKYRAHSAASAVLTINAGRRGAALTRMWISAVILAMSTTTTACTLRSDYDAASPPIGVTAFADCTGEGEWSFLATSDWIAPTSTLRSEIPLEVMARPASHEGFESQFNCFRTPGTTGHFPGLCDQQLVHPEPGPAAGEVAIHPGHSSEVNHLLDVRWTNTGENAAHIRVVWTFRKLSCTTTVNFAVFVDGAAQNVEFRDTPFNDQSPVELSFEGVVSLGGSVDWMFSNAGNWACDNSALSIQLLLSQRSDCSTGQYADVCDAKCSLPQNTTGYDFENVLSLGLGVASDWGTGVTGLGLPNFPSDLAELGAISCVAPYGGTAQITCPLPVTTQVTTDATRMSQPADDISWAHGWWGCANGVDGRIYGMPHLADAVLIIDPVAGTTDTTSMAGLGSGGHKWWDGALAPNGKIYGFPRHSTSILIVDTVAQTTDTTSLSGIDGGDKWNDGVLAPNGKLYGIPERHGAVIVVDPVATTWDITSLRHGGAGSRSHKLWWGGVLGTDGKIYGIPTNAHSVLIVDPAASSTDVTSMSVGSGTDKWWTGCIGPNNKIYGIPITKTSVLIIDTATGAIDTSSIPVGSGSFRWSGAVLASDLTVYSFPWNGGSVLAIDTIAGTSSTLDVGIDGSDKWPAGALGVDGKVYAAPFRATGPSAAVLIVEPVQAGTFVLSGCEWSGCPAGQYDHDSNVSTPCQLCRVGTYTPAGQLSCVSCISGTADTDSDPSTACAQCEPGFFSPVQATSCTSCETGYVDHDADPATPCIEEVLISVTFNFFNNVDVVWRISELELWCGGTNLLAGMNATMIESSVPLEVPEDSMQWGCRRASPSWCSHGSNGGAQLIMDYDCDGDGFSDIVCTDARALQSYSHIIYSSGAGCGSFPCDSCRDGGRAWGSAEAADAACPSLDAHLGRSSYTEIRSVPPGSNLLLHPEQETSIAGTPMPTLLPPPPPIDCLNGICPDNLYRWTDGDLKWCSPWLDYTPATSGSSLVFPGVDVTYSSSDYIESAVVVQSDGNHSQNWSVTIDGVEFFPGGWDTEVDAPGSCYVVGKSTAHIGWEIGRSCPGGHYDHDDNASTTCVALPSSAVQTWGQNTYGQLALGSSADQNTPQNVPLLGADTRRIVCGGAYCFGLKASGGWVSWGGNTYGQLALGSSADQNTPQNVPLLGADTRRIVCGGPHCFGSKASGGWVSWGGNTYGQLALGSNADQNTPQNVPLLGADTRRIVCGGAYCFGLKASGGWVSWGRNHRGQLALGSITDNVNSPQHTPLLTMLGSDMVRIVCAHERGYCFGYKAGGGWRAWGHNNYGQLALGVETGIMSEPRDVPLLHEETKQVACANTACFGLRGYLEWS
eukprot:COSAG02_NODE_4165_length_5680_cov_13.045164_2_plen_1511_part_00